MESAELLEVPPELREAIELDAVQDAERVAQWLHRFESKHSLEKQRVWPAGFLLDLAAALRLQHWETLGLTVHLENGLPDSAAAFKTAGRNLLAALHERECGTRLISQVHPVFAERFCWMAKVELCADVVICFSSEEGYLEAIAEFVWQNRDVLSRKDGGPES